MPINNQEILNFLHQLSEEENLKVTVTESMKGACIAGGGALLGGLMGGPVGLAVGGTVGSLCAAWRGQGKFKSVASVIMYDMTDAQRGRLANSMQIVFNDLRVEDLVMLSTLAMGNPSVHKMIILELGRFLKNEMGLQIA